MIKLRPVFVFILLVLLTYNGFGQLIEIHDKSGKKVNSDTLLVAFHPGPDHGWTEINIFLNVVNKGTTTMSMNVKKTEYNIQPGEYHSFCFAGFCQDSSVFVSPYQSTLVSGATDSSFSGHFRFDDLLHKPGECMVSYTFYDFNNPNDSSIVYVNYNTSLFADLNEWVKGGFEDIRLFPNPCRQAFFLDIPNSVIHEPIKIEIISVTGELIHSYNLSPENNGLGIDVKDLPAGIYIFRLTQSSDNVVTKRFIIDQN